MLDEDPIKELIGKICVVKIKNKKFMSKLIATDGDELWFVNRAGAYSMMRRCDVLAISKFAPKNWGEVEVI
jgi:hypothetical protein